MTSTPIRLLSARPQRLLVIGGAYAGLSLVQNLLTLVKGSSESHALRSPLNITILDERDGFCKCNADTYAEMASAEFLPPM
jgi:hypothetical protein